MSAERYIFFKDKNWYTDNDKLIIKNLEDLRTFIKTDKENTTVLLRETYGKQGDWDYDVRFIFKATYIFLEISSHGPEITYDLKKLLNWIRSKTEIRVEDEDGVLSDW